VSYGPGSRCAVEFGATTFATQTTQILATFPRSGEYYLVVQNVTELPGGVPLQVDGMTLTLRLAVSDEVLRVKVRGGAKGHATSLLSTATTHKPEMFIASS
jgi:hypothetical protein